MMINVITASPDAAPVGAASAHPGENSGFASLLGEQIAVINGRFTPVTPDKQGEADKLTEEEIDAAAAGLIPAGLAEAIVTPLSPEAINTAAAQPTAADLTRSLAAPLSNMRGTHNNQADAPVSDDETAQSMRHSATNGMLRMIASPQSAHHAGKPASPQSAQHPDTPANPQWQQSITTADLIKPAINVALSLSEESRHAVLPVENRSAAMPLSASPAFAPASLSTPAATPSATSATLPIAYGMLEPEVGSPAWQQALGQKLSTFTRNGVHHAELRLHPEHLGPLHIKLRLDQDQVQLHFVTDQQPVRAALEAAMPHLRTSLADAGIQLDQGSIGRDDSAWGASADSQSGQSSPSEKEADGSPLIEAEEEIIVPRIYSPLGISIFA